MPPSSAWRCTHPDAAIGRGDKETRPSGHRLRRGHRFRRGLSLAVAMVLCGLVAGMGAVPAEAVTDGKLVLLLDSSGSMKEKVGGDTKIKIAKRALNTVIGRLPADAQTGLRVYGATVFDRSDKGACTDSQLVVPIGTGNRQQLKDAVAGYRPYGETPISYSLTQAAKDLGTSGRRTVVLVSDGEETCKADPCTTAEQLAKRGIDLKFDVIGLRVSGRARSQLQCIAEKGNGTYYDAENAQQIEDSLEKLATRAFRPFRLNGTPVRGNTDASQPTQVGPGQYTDRFPSVSAPLYYSIPRTVPGSTIRVGFTSEAAGFAPYVLGTLSTGQTTFCSNGAGSVINILGTRNVVTGEVSSWQESTDSDCNTAPAMTVKLGGNKDLAGRPFELLISEEPPVVDAQGLPPAEDTISWQSMKAGSPAARPPVPGTSISDAPRLTDGTYSTTILTGEKQVFGVDLDWGQRLQVQVLVPPRRGALAKAMGQLDSMDIQLLSPMRGAFRSLPTQGVPENTLGMIDDSKTYRASATTPTVRYLNRDGDASIRPGALPGTYSVVLSKSRTRSEAAFLVPYVLVIKVIGTAGQGAPRYQSSGASGTPTATATAGASGTPSVAPASAAPSSTSVPTDSGDGVRPGVVVAVGAAALVVGAGIAAAAIAWPRRRRHAR